MPGRGIGDAYAESCRGYRVEDVRWREELRRWGGEGMRWWGWLEDFRGWGGERG